MNFNPFKNKEKSDTNSKSLTSEDRFLSIVKQQLAAAENRLIGKLLSKRTEAHESRSHGSTNSKGLRRPELNFEFLVELAESSYPLTRVFDALHREIGKLSIDIEPLFNFKCISCDKEFQERPDFGHCDECGDYVIAPDPFQKRRLKRLLNNPNQDNSLNQILTTVIYYLLPTDNFYYEILYKYPVIELNGELYQNGNKKAVGWQILDTRITYKTVNEHNQHGSEEYFCPFCIQKALHEGKTPPTNYTTKGKRQTTCKTCGGKLEETFYVQEINGQIVARWGKDDVFQGTRRQVIPDLYGRPLMKALFEALEFVEYTDKENAARAVTGQGLEAVIFPGLSSEQIKDLYNQLDWINDNFKGRFRTKFLGILGMKGNPFTLEASKTPADLQLAEWYDKYLEAIATTFSVILKWVGKETPGRLGHFDIDVEIQEAAITNITRVLESVFKEMFSKTFGISDWIVTFGEFKKEDELHKIQIEQEKANVVTTYHNLGIKAEWDHDNNLVLSPLPKSEQELKSEKVPFPYRIKRMKSFPSELNETFSKILIEGIEEEKPVNDVKIEMEKAAMQVLDRKLNLDEIKNLKIIIRTEMARIRNTILWNKFEEREELLGIEEIMNGVVLQKGTQEIPSYARRF